MPLRLSSDRKTANLATPNGKGAKIKNAFGLASGRAFSCPGATTVCERVCYAGKLERLFPNMRSMMIDNYNAVVSNSWADNVRQLSALITEFERECVRHGAVKAFRIHHDGDFVSRSYASAWAMVIRLHPAVHFWAYTRSFTPGINVVDILADIPNLSLYISVDSDNIRYANVITDEYRNVKVALLSDTVADGQDAMMDITGRPGGACPEVIGRIPLITPAGGACFSCQLCVKGKADIVFSITKR